MMSFAQYVAVATCGFGVAAFTGSAVITILYFRSLGHSRVASTFVALFGGIAAAAVSLTFTFAFGFVVSIDRQASQFVVLYMVFVFAPILAAAAVHKRLPTELIAILRALERNGSSKPAA